MKDQLLMVGKTITYSQVRNRFNKLVSKCKVISLSERRANVVTKCRKAMKIGRISFLLLASRESAANSSNIV